MTSQAGFQRNCYTQELAEIKDLIYQHKSQNNYIKRKQVFDENSDTDVNKNLKRYKKKYTLREKATTWLFKGYKTFI